MQQFIHTVPRSCWCTWRTSTISVGRSICALIMYEVDQAVYHSSWHIKAVPATRCTKVAPRLNFNIMYHVCAKYTKYTKVLPSLLRQHHSKRIVSPGTPGYLPSISTDICSKYVPSTPWQHQVQEGICAQDLISAHPNSRHPGLPSTQLEPTMKPMGAKYSGCIQAHFCSDDYLLTSEAEPKLSKSFLQEDFPQTSLSALPGHHH